MSEPEWDNYKDFRREEFVCPCCGKAYMSPVTMDRLQRLRSWINEPLIISSGYRCPDYNAQISSTGRDGPHTRGRAADIATTGNRARNVVGMAISCGFTGIGVKQHGPHDGRFIHLDDLGADYEPRPWLWSYS